MFDDFSPPDPDDLRLFAITLVNTGLFSMLLTGLKMGGIIDWEWLWVVAPLWVMAAAGTNIILAVNLLHTIKKYSDFYQRKKGSEDA